MNYFISNCYFNGRNEDLPKSTAVLREIVLSILKNSGLCIHLRDLSFSQIDKYNVTDWLRDENEYIQKKQITQKSINDEKDRLNMLENYPEKFRDEYSYYLSSLKVSKNDDYFLKRSEKETALANDIAAIFEGSNLVNILPEYFKSEINDIIATAKSDAAEDLAYHNKRKKERKIMKTKADINFETYISNKVSESKTRINMLEGRIGEINRTLDSVKNSNNCLIDIFKELDKIDPPEKETVYDQS